MEKQQRTLTISRQIFDRISYPYDPGTKEIPFIRMGGDWLRDAGFNIGDRITVCVDNGKLIISKNTETLIAMPETKRRA